MTPIVSQIWLSSSAPCDWFQPDFVGSLPDNSRGFSRNAATTIDHHHGNHSRNHPSPPVEPPAPEKVNISNKMETIDYSHGVSAAISASRGWGTDGGGAGGGGEQVQSVDYHHGQGTVPGAGGMGDYAGRGFPPTEQQGAYGGFPPYANYEGSAGVQSGGFFPQGIDAATLFAAYNEQTGEL